MEIEAFGLLRLEGVGAELHLGRLPKEALCLVIRFMRKAKNRSAIRLLQAYSFSPSDS